MQCNTICNTANNYYAGEVFQNYRSINTDSEEFDEEIRQGEKSYIKLKMII